MAAGLRQDQVDDGVRRPRRPLVEHARCRACTPLRSSAPRTERRPPCRQRSTERGHALRTGPRAVGDDEHADLALGQRSEPGQVSGVRPVGVVDEQRNPRVGPA